MEAKAGWTNIYIYPGYRFKVMDGLITNFHLPESTLIMLVSAFAGREHILAAYEEAVRGKVSLFQLRRRDVPLLIFSNFACTLPDFEVKFSELLIFSVIFY